MWAKSNLDFGSPTGFAPKPESVGSYYSWANVQGHKFGDGYGFTEQDYLESDGNNVQENIEHMPGNNHDAANVKLGGNWCMPSKDDFAELFENCSINRVSIDGKRVWILTSNINGESLTLPACGFIHDNVLSDPYSYGNYWTTNFISATNAIRLTFHDETYDTNSSVVRRNGYNIRPIIKPATP